MDNRMVSVVTEILRDRQNDHSIVLHEEFNTFSITKIVVEILLNSTQEHLYN